MLTIHHLQLSQSERIIFLCEELGIDYVLKTYPRDLATRLAPPEYRALHPTGTAPVISDGGIVLGESGAIMEYILARYGQGRLAPPSQDATYPDYLFWFHFANGTFQPAIMRDFVLDWGGVAADNRMRAMATERLKRAYDLIEARLAQTDYLASSFTAADIMIVFSLTTMRAFRPCDLEPFPAICAYLRRIGGRKAYQRAMRAGDPDLAPLLT